MKREENEAEKGEFISVEEALRRQLIANQRISPALKNKLAEAGIITVLDLLNFEPREHGLNLFLLIELTVWTEGLKDHLLENAININ